MNEDDKHYLKILETELAEAEDILKCEQLAADILRSTIQAHHDMSVAYGRAAQIARSLSEPNVRGVPTYIAEANTAAVKIYYSIVNLKTLEIKREQLTLNIKAKYVIPGHERRAKECKDRLLKFLKQQEDKELKANEKVST